MCFLSVTNIVLIISAATVTRLPARGHDPAGD